jgi:hypothetical protein
MASSSYWTYPCGDLTEAWYALLCIWRGSWLRRHLFYFSAAERAYRWHLARARVLDCPVYCVAHACDSRQCETEHDFTPPVGTPGIP